MRYARQNMILQLISEHNIKTQESLVQHLKDAGFKVTQATISRDIKELHLIKTPVGDGTYKYAATVENTQYIADRYINILKDTVKDVAISGNILVVKTLSACANAAGEAVDNLEFPHILGSVAGDNTLLVVIDDPENAEEVIDRFHSII